MGACRPQETQQQIFAEAVERQALRRAMSKTLKAQSGRQTVNTCSQMYDHVITAMRRVVKGEYRGLCEFPEAGVDFSL